LLNNALLQMNIQCKSKLGNTKSENNMNK